MAINSGLVAYPTGYEHVWESQGVHVWRPVAPPAHVAMGCVATTTASPPALKQVVCVHERAVVEAALAECMLLCANGKLWCVQNNVGTFEVSPPDVHPPKVRAGWITGAPEVRLWMVQERSACHACNARAD